MRRADDLDWSARYCAVLVDSLPRGSRLEAVEATVWRAMLRKVHEGLDEQDAFLDALDDALDAERRRDRAVRAASSRLAAFRGGDAAFWDDTAPDVSGPTWACGACTLENASTALVCGACGAARRTEDDGARAWACGVCTFVSEDRHLCCGACGTARPAA